MDNDRALRMILECNRILVRTQDEQTLLDEICQVIVSIGGYRMAWVGYRLDDEGKTVHPAAQKGFEDGYLEHIRITWEDVAEGRGPTGTAIREGKPVIAHSILRDIAFAPWREAALQRGYHSSIALPLKWSDETSESKYDNVIGALNIYAAESDAFDKEEANLLSELANDLAFGISVLRTRAQRNRAEEMFYKAFHNSPNVIILTSMASGKIVDVSESLESLTGYTRKEVIGKTTLNLGFWENPAIRDQYIDQLKDEGKVREMEVNFLTKAGEVRQALLSGEIIDLQDGKYILAIVRDITARRQAEEEIRGRVDQLAALLDASQKLNASLDLPIVLQAIVESATTVLSQESAAIYLLDGDNLFLGATTPALPDNLPDAFRWAELSDHPHIGRSFQSKQPVILQDSLLADLTDAERMIITQRGLRSLLYVPLIAVEKIVGVIILGKGTAVNYTSAQIDLARTYANMAAIAIQNAKLVDETQRRLVELDAIYRITTALRAAQTLEEVQSVMLSETLLALGLEHGSILLYDSASRELQQTAANGWLAKLNGKTVQPGEGVAGKVFESGEHYVTKDFSKDMQVPTKRRYQIPRGWGGVCVPIRTTDTIIGVLFAVDKSSREFSDEDINLLCSLTDIAGMAIHRVRLYEQTELRLRLMQALYRIDITITASLDMRITLNVLLDQLIHQMKVSAASVLLFNPVTNNLEYAAGQGFRTKIINKAAFRPGENLAGKAMLERRIISYRETPGSTEQETRPDIFVEEEFVSYYGTPLVAKGQVLGVLEIYHRSELDLEKEWLDFLEALSAQAAIAIDDATLFENLQRTNYELARAYDTTLEGWSHALDLRDRETEGHTQRVTELTLSLAQAMGVNENDLVHIRRGALLHDIGKMGIPDNILLKPGPLTEEEWTIMKMHPTYAYDLLSPIDYLRPAIEIPYSHHEKWDGSGYPRGLKSNQIPLPARIFAVVDCWDALLSDRPYRSAWPLEKARKYILELSGTHYDPQVVEAFFNIV